MIRIQVVYVNGFFSSLQIEGHGGEEYGKDIYCAGVSSCFYGALNALDHAENYDYQLESGFGQVSAKSKSVMHDEIVMETLITQLSTIAKSFPQKVNIKISKKEG